MSDTGNETPKGVGDLGGSDGAEKPKALEPKQALPSSILVPVSPQAETARFSVPAVLKQLTPPYQEPQTKDAFEGRRVPDFDVTPAEISRARRNDEFLRAQLANPQLADLLHTTAAEQQAANPDGPARAYVSLITFPEPLLGPAVPRLILSSGPDKDDGVKLSLFTHDRNLPGAVKWVDVDLVTVSSDLTGAPAYQGEGNTPGENQLVKIDDFTGVDVKETFMSGDQALVMRNATDPGHATLFGTRFLTDGAIPDFDRVTPERMSLTLQGSITELGATPHPEPIIPPTTPAGPPPAPHL